MSHVRRCDKCGNIFSEVESGWQTYTATTMIEDENGGTKEVKQALDACPSCALVPRRQFARETDAVLDAREQDARIAALERQTGMNVEAGQFEHDGPDGVKKA